MLTIDDLRPYQVEDAKFIVEHPASMLWLDVGLGKTITALTAIAELFDRGQVHGVLVLAPLSVVRAVWRQEAAAWQHTEHLRCSLVHGTPAERGAAIRAEADLYLMNYENLPWLVGHLHKKKQGVPFNMVVYDEVTKMKNSTAKRVKSMRRMLPFVDVAVGLTGTPAPNGYLDLHGQYLVVDKGERLGAAKTHYRDSYFMSDYMGYNWELRQGSKESINDKIRDITVQRRKEDHLDLPPVIYRDIWLDMGVKERKIYEELERDFFAEIDGGEVEAFNAAGLSNKCRQYANGACYTDDGKTGYSVAHDVKLGALRDIIETSSGPVLVAYNFRHDLERIKAVIPDAVSVKDAPIEEIVGKWNRGEIRVLLGHPASMGHGLNLQYGGSHLVMFGLTWNLEEYMQVIGRLDRSGQESPVTVTRLLMENTVERAVAMAIDAKTKTQNGLRKAIEEYRRAA